MKWLAVTITATLALGACTDGGRQAGSPAPKASPTEGSVEWRGLAPVPTARTEVAAAAFGDQIGVIGGFIPGGGSTEIVEIYDTTTDSWTQGPDLPHAVNHPMAASLDGKVYVFGGYIGSLNNPSDRAFVFDGNGWEELARMPFARAAGGAAAAQGKLYVVGGVTDPGLGIPVLEYDPATEIWARFGWEFGPREHLGVAGFDDKIYVMGGRTGGIGSNLSTAQSFDPAASQDAMWTDLPGVPTPRGGLGATATESGLIVVPGGEAATTFEEVEVFDIESNSWLTLPPLPTPRHGLGVVAIGDVVYVLAGGPVPGASFSSANESIDLGPL